MFFNFIPLIHRSLLKLRFLNIVSFAFQQNRIGFDVAEKLVHADETNFFEMYGIDLSAQGGLTKPKPPRALRAVTMLQRSTRMNLSFFFFSFFSA